MTKMYELSDAELDTVAAGQGQALGQVALVGVAAQLQDFLNDAEIHVLSDNQHLIEIGDVQVGVGAGVAILSGAALGLVRQTQ